MPGRLSPPISAAERLPGADELFRTTSEASADSERNGERGRGSGRIRHDEKITVYVSGEELLALEQARLELRASYGMAVDRGRIVREAVAAALAELEVAGADSGLVRRIAGP